MGRIRAHDMRDCHQRQTICPPHPSHLRLGWSSLGALGISVRILLSLTGHWAIGHFAHHKGQQSWTIAGLPVQGFWLTRTLAALKLAHNIRLPDSAPPREGLTRQP